ncbi:MAG TPA: alanyl-tRNA editing protein [Bryobacteraceae bacterium]|nr:alanyl-tRNA editing protein [Bryobacteraceae bacterium]
MTERLYYTDCYLTRFDAQALSVSGDGLRAVLDRSAFYPTSGGQLFDTGELNGIRVREVIDDGELVVHLLEAPIAAGPVQGCVDWERRFAFMQQHTGQHLLSAVFHEQFGFATASVHLGEEGGTVELEAGALSDEQLREAETRANAVITANLPVTIAFEENPQGLRKPSERTGPLRVVTIEGVDKSACGGTHVHRTGEIGSLLLRRQEKIRGNTRVEFVCGRMAVRRARLDFDLLSAAARVVSRPVEEMPAAVAALQEAARESAKSTKALALELAAYRGREQFAAASPGQDGVRRHWAQLAAVDEAARAAAQTFLACGPGIYLATGGGAALVAASPEAGVHCGNLLKQFGRGGGGAAMAQGGLPDPAPLAAALGFPG